MRSARYGWLLLVGCGGESTQPEVDSGPADATIEVTLDGSTDVSPEISTDADSGLEAEATVDADAADVSTPTPTWARGEGPVLGVSPPMVAVDAAGNVYVAAISTLGSTLGGCAVDSGVLASFDALGKPRWSKCLPGEGISSLAAGTDRVVIGSCQLAAGVCEALVRVFDGTGKEIWTRNYPSASSTTIPTLAVASTGHVVFGLRHPAALDPGTGSLPPRTSLIRLRPDGSVEWARSLGDQSLDVVALDAAGRVYVAGTGGGLLDYGDGPKSRPQQVWVASYTSTNTFRFVHGFEAASGRLAFAVDPTGGTLWVSPVVAKSGAKLPSGGALTLGGTYVVALDGTTGLDTWHLLVERRVALAALGSDVVVAGRNAAGVLLQRFDTKGKPLWPAWTPSLGAADPKAQEATAVAITPARQVVLAGVFRGALDFGGAGTLKATDLVTDAGKSEDLFVAQLSP